MLWILRQDVRKRHLLRLWVSCVCVWAVVILDNHRKKLCGPWTDRTKDLGFIGDDRSISNF
jgi:hypothetical protein